MVDTFTLNNKPADSVVAGTQIIPSVNPTTGAIEKATVTNLFASPQPIGATTPSTGAFTTVSGQIIFGGEQVEKTISSGAITIDDGESFIRIDTEADAATDDLDSISGGATGTRLIITCVTTSRTPTLKDGSSLKLAGDFDLTHPTDTIELIKSTSGSWLELSRSDNQ